MGGDNKNFSGPDERAFVELRELNRQVLTLMRLQALGETERSRERPVFVALREIWERLGPEPVARAAAACPCLLADFGFLDERRWSAVANDLVQDQERMSPFFDVAQADAVARAVLTEAWHYARTHGVLLGLFGIPTRVALLIERCSQTQILALAERHSGWLQPRWPSRVWFWEGLLNAALKGDENALRRSGTQAAGLLASQMVHGLQP